MKKLVSLVIALLLLTSADLTAQNGLEATCARGEVRLLGAEDECLAAVQAAVSAQPSLGLLIAGGNPTLGTAGGGGFRLGILPRVGAGVRLNAVAVRLPDIIADQIPGQAGSLTRRFGAPLPAINGDASVAVTRGVSVAPGLGGIGAVSLLGSISYLPLRLLGAEEFEDAPESALGFGARLQLLGESFIAPGLSVSVMRRSLGTVDFGNVCDAATVNASVPGSSPPQTVAACPTTGDAGEISFDLSNWSTRVVASKHLLGFGLAAGLGHDRNSSDLAYGFRSKRPVTGTTLTPVFRVTDEELSSSRWTVFGNASLSLLVGTIGIEAGWQQGNAPISGFDDLGSDFDPGAGTWFGSVGARLSL